MTGTNIFCSNLENILLQITLTCVTCTFLYQQQLAGMLNFQSDLQSWENLAGGMRQTGGCFV